MKVNHRIVIIVFALLFTIATAMGEDSLSGERAISDVTPSLGDSIYVTVDVNITGNVFGPILKEEIPNNWNVVSIEDAGATFKSTSRSWLWLGVQTGAKKIVYKVTIPSNEVSNEYSITGTLIGTVDEETIGPYDILGDNAIKVTIDDANSRDTKSLPLYSTNVSNDSPETTETNNEVSINITSTPIEPLSSEKTELIDEDKQSESSGSENQKSPAIHLVFVILIIATVKYFTTK